MEHDQGLRTGICERPRGGSAGAVFSRRRVLDRLRAAVERGQACPGLVTGEPGAGKTWLGRQLAHDLPASWNVSYVDLTRALTALDFFQLIGHSLGVPLAESLGVARARLRTALHDEDIEGRRWLLVIDEAHRGSPSVWDEIHALGNQSDARGGFGALVVLGDTELLRVFATREFSGIASAVQLHLHLPPLDLDEARELLKFAGQSHVADGWALEELHRDARGNASGLVRLARGRPAGRPPRSELAPARAAGGDDLACEMSSDPLVEAPRAWDELQRHQPVSAPLVAAAVLQNGRLELPSLFPTKPPIRVEEGLVEVGWDGDLETESSQPLDVIAATELLPADDSSFDEEPIEDHYATLQARSEWMEGHEKTTNHAVMAGGSRTKILAEPSFDGPTAVAEEPAGSTAALAGVRAEGQHEFAPYSQLFTGTRQSKQP